VLIADLHPLVQPLLILEELGLPYTITLLSFGDLIGPEFKKINPGGKVPGKYYSLDLQRSTAAYHRTISYV